jgi:glycine cleavage system H lipoate-binding protein
MAIAFRDFLFCARPDKTAKMTAGQSPATIAGVSPLFLIEPPLTEPASAQTVFRLSLDPQFLESIGGQVLALELAPPESRFHAGDAFGLGYAPTSTFDLRAPENMQIIATNRELKGHPELAALSPSLRGWLIDFIRADY